MTTRKKDHTNAIIIGFVLLMLGCIVFSVAFEILKFVAVVKWVFS